MKRDSGAIRYQKKMGDMISSFSPSLHLRMGSHHEGLSGDPFSPLAPQMEVALIRKPAGAGPGLFLMSFSTGIVPWLRRNTDECGVRMLSSFILLLLN